MAPESLRRASMLQRRGPSARAPVAPPLVVRPRYALVRRGVERALEKLGIAGYGDFQACVEDSPNYEAPIDDLVEDLLLSKFRQMVTG